VVVTGTTGESPLLSDDEKARLWEEVKQELGNSATVVAGSGTNDTHHSVELAHRAERAGVDAILAVAPYYLKPPQEGIYQHFRAIAESTRLPVIVYNVPGRTGVNVTVDTLLRCAEVPNIVGDKEANGTSPTAPPHRGSPRLPHLVWQRQRQLPPVVHGCVRRH
jgi:4-hydroxy-tetrahydrodipicolinate synthase